jgi:Na+-transporting methylmalonyl-CoA/oxaloacetate decarboxylase gamma subunit
LDNSLSIALLITVIGMSLLFLSLVLFYGLLSLLTTVTKDRPHLSAQHAAGKDNGQAVEEQGGEEEPVLRAAAVAIALARAEAEQGLSLTVASTTEEGSAGQQVSPWWSLHHQRQLTQSSCARRRR